MSTKDKDNPRDESELFDLLVDGELDEQSRRKLLSGLDDTPTGWRKCALAFLQAQSFEQGLGDVSLLDEVPAGAAESKQRGTETEPRRVRTPRRPWLLKNAATFTAMAASFFFALMLGVAVRDEGRDSGATGIAPRGSFASLEEPVGRSANVVPVAQRRASQRPNSPNSPWTVATLNSPEEGGRSIRVPVVQQKRINEPWLQAVPPAMPEEVKQALERTGHEVRQTRQLVPLNMKDGRQLVVPVDQVDVDYVGNPPL